MGTYSDNLSKKLAKRLVVNKKHPVFSKYADPQIQFWFKQGDRTLHYGRGSYEGSLRLNKIGIKFYNNYRGWI